MKKTLLLLISALFLACDAGVLWKDHPYQVNWIDAENNRTLTYEIDEGTSIGRVDAEVIAVGSNEKWIVAKQKPTNGDAISYFYIERAKDNKSLNSNEITKGPFDEVEFLKLKEELELPEFGKEFLRGIK
jgi:hypothetical protein